MDERLSLYMFEGCPYCEKVRVAIRDLELPVEMRDVHADQAHLNTLIEELGVSTVPVLRIDEGEQTRWLSESSDIVKHLYETWGDGRPPAFLATDGPQAIGGMLALLFLVLALIIEGPARLVLLGSAALAWIGRNHATRLAKR